MGSITLNDTGIDWCADGRFHKPVTDLTCPVASYPGQDGEFGRDADARAGTLLKVGAGAAGFDFTKIANNGSELPAAALLGSGPNDWACTRDNVTGLIWEVKTSDGGLRDKLNTYTWFDPNSPDGDPGLQDYGTCVGSSCDTTGFVQAVNAQGLCGASDWRMPTWRELQGIVDFGRYFPAIDTDYFPNAYFDNTQALTWSGSPSRFGNAWTVKFDVGQIESTLTRHLNALHVRLVRGE